MELKPAINARERGDRERADDVLSELVESAQERRRISQQRMAGRQAKVGDAGANSRMIGVTEPAALPRVHEVGVAAIEQEPERNGVAV